MHRFAWTLIAVSSAALVIPSLTSAAPRMLLGFHDDATFRWDPRATGALDAVAAANASVIRTTVDWRAVAPRRPRNPTNPFDAAYRLTDLDDLARSAQRRGILLMITIWGTPTWANGGRGPTVPPKKLADLRDFARAVADRYSGRHAGYPYVGRYSIWNEPNLEIFLSPQFDKKGKIVSPRTYSRLYRAGYKGIKAANSRALVAIGETSNQGRDRPAKDGLSDSVAPGTFARLLAQHKGLKFDAYATHPYPTYPNLPPTEKVRWPNVTLSQLNRFEKSIDRWFGRADIPIWITEYGYQTKPPDLIGVTAAQQAAYLRRVIQQLRANPRVQLFIWFVFRDSKHGLWQSGLFDERGRMKPSYKTFSSLARSVCGETLTIKPGVAPTIELAVPKLAFVTPAGSTIGITYRVYDGRRLVAVGQPARRLRISQSVTFVANFKPAIGKTYRIEMDAGDASGNHQFTTYALVTARRG